MALPSVVEIDLFCGVTVHVTPLSQLSLVGIVKKARELHPDPDPEKYRKPIEGSAIEGDTFIDRDNPEYRAELGDISRLRNEYMLFAMTDLACSFPDGRDALIEKYKGKRDRMAAYFDVPTDEWEFTLMHVLMAHQQDFDRVQSVAQNKAPLTEEETRGALRIFRLDL